MSLKLLATFLLMLPLNLLAEDYMQDPCVKSCNDNRRADYSNVVQVIACMDSCSGRTREKDEPNEKIPENPLQTIQIGPLINPCSAMNYGGNANTGGDNGQDNQDQTKGNVEFPLSYQDGPEPIKGEEQVKWDECNEEHGGKFVSKYAESESCQQFDISKEFIQFFEQNFSQCVNEAFSGGNIEGLSIEHKGIAGDSSHSNNSNHSVNRAIDISKITVKAGGKEEIFNLSDQDQEPQKTFFNSLRDCWSTSMDNYKANCPGSAPKGSIGHEDHDHEHHLHLSLPYCPKKGDYYSK